MAVCRNGDRILRHVTVEAVDRLTALLRTGRRPVHRVRFRPGVAGRIQILCLGKAADSAYALFTAAAFTGCGGYDLPFAEGMAICRDHGLVTHRIAVRAVDRLPPLFRAGRRKIHGELIFPVMTLRRDRFRLLRPAGGAPANLCAFRKAAGSGHFRPFSVRMLYNSNGT